MINSKTELFLLDRNILNALYLSKIWNIGIINQYLKPFNLVRKIRYCWIELLLLNSNSCHH